MLDIVLHGIPKSWHKKMDEHDFDPHEGSLEDLVSFCERLESAESHDRAPDKQVVNGRIPKKKKGTFKKGSSSSDQPTGKWCEFHETDTHNTAECETLKRLKRDRAKWWFQERNFQEQDLEASVFRREDLHQEGIGRDCRKGFPCSHSQGAEGISFMLFPSARSMTPLTPLTEKSTRTMTTLLSPATVL